jgi:hypothetical protein
MEKPTADGEAHAAQLPILVIGSGKRQLRRLLAHHLTPSQELLDSPSHRGSAKYVHTRLCNARCSLIHKIGEYSVHGL